MSLRAVHQCYYRREVFYLSGTIDRFITHARKSTIGMAWIVHRSGIRVYYCLLIWSFMVKIDTYQHAHLGRKYLRLGIRWQHERCCDSGLRLAAEVCCTALVEQHHLNRFVPLLVAPRYDIISRNIVHDSF